MSTYATVDVPGETDWLRWCLTTGRMLTTDRVKPYILQPRQTICISRLQ